MMSREREDNFDDHPRNVPVVGCETLRLSSRPPTGYSTDRDISFYRGRSFYNNPSRQSDTYDKKKEKSIMSDEYIQREQSILSRHEGHSFPEKPRELFNPLNGLIPEQKVSPKSFNVLPAISTPRSLTSRSLTSQQSTSSQLRSHSEMAASSGQRLTDITPVTLPPINSKRWKALKQSDDLSTYNERRSWDVVKTQSRQSDTSNSCGYNSSEDYL